MCVKMQNLCFLVFNRPVESSSYLQFVTRISNENVIIVRANYICEFLMDTSEINNSLSTYLNSLQHSVVIISEFLPNY